ncbi:hypothetical protein [Bacillus pseudomycoides]|uniref:hypothetical protein n=1 Tax=Bacillus pseudomycoides TaxID=64104 RepID=UPI000BEB9121|nr:hypothetical protein [Bacillus pseudomycoides]PEE42830.1 hypothetical protein COO02_05785 [Bacillus pseudomycoides]PEI42619.1 hypothetical protein CN620_09195 [Bacillus pseudomycoides]PGA90931.1 hypothetical protein COL91_12540 [Bacillus pseudomycoides]PGD26793.1 hypothetical protein COM32_12885 [Bacillus pseudomycoides]PHG24708.1 hypothetical protein COI47_07920 [Bacillus pseudomycoides]
METVTIHRYQYKEIIKAVREKEDAGYEHVTPIRKIQKDGKIYHNAKQKINGITNKKTFLYEGQYGNVGYMCVMRKVE